MKIICTSDWHLGNLFHGNDRLPEHEHFLRWLLRQIVEQQPDALLVAGDVFDNGNPSAVAQSAYYKFLADATQLSSATRIIITAGNHDSANRLEAPRQLLARYQVEVRGSIARHWVTEADGRGDWQFDYDDLMIPVTNAAGETVIVLAVPYLRHDVVGGGSYSSGVNNFLHTLSECAHALYPDVPQVMMAHMYATGADIARQDASERIIIGGQEEVNMEGWSDHPDYLTCGHIHKRQHIWDTDWARYTGSVLPMSFAEKDYTHGVDLVTLTTGQRPIVQHLSYEPQHKLVVLPEDDTPLTAKKLNKLINEQLPDRIDGQLDEHWVYVALKVMQEKVNNDEIQQLEQLIATKNAVLCKIQRILPQVDVSAMGGDRHLTSIDEIVNRDPMEALREAYVLKHNVELSEPQEALLTEIINNIKNEPND